MHTHTHARDNISKGLSIQTSSTFLLLQISLILCGLPATCSPNCLDYNFHFDALNHSPYIMSLKENQQYSELIGLYVASYRIGPAHCADIIPYHLVKRTKLNVTMHVSAR